MTISKIMIVDDDEDIRLVSELTARRIGKWEVVQVADGADALERARDEKPDVILLDVMMPDVDGPTALAMLRGDPTTAGIPVIFLTARAQRHEVERYMALGATGVIVKPFDVTTLVDDIRSLVDGG